MPAHTIQLSDPQAVLRILLALVEEGGGEIRFKARTFDCQERGRLLTVDYDKRRSQVVIRSTTDLGAVVQVSPEAHQWSQPPQVAPTERARAAAAMEAERSSVLDDEALAEAEERMVRNRQAADDLRDGKSPLRINVKK